MLQIDQDFQKEFRNEGERLAKEYLAECYQLAQNSPDPSSQNGAVILGIHEDEFGVIGRGWNAPPVNFTMTPEREKRPAKYWYYGHAERRAIFQAAKYGRATGDTVMVCPWACCCDCARAIIFSGISTLIVHKQRMDIASAWSDNIREAHAMLEAEGVGIVFFDAPIDGPSIRVSGEGWSPCNGN